MDIAATIAGTLSTTLEAHVDGFKTDSPSPATLTAPMRWFSRWLRCKVRPGQKLTAPSTADDSAERGEKETAHRSLALKDGTIALSFGPYEVKTVRLQYRDGE